MWSPNIDLHEDYLDLLILLMETQLLYRYICGATKSENFIFETVKQTSDKFRGNCRSNIISTLPPCY